MSANGEAAWVRALRVGFGDAVAGPGVRVGIGDDAAVLEMPAGQRLVATVDMLVEGQHFQLAGPGASTPEDVGWHALAVNLSDLAAMGARPLWALCSLGLPPGVPPEFGTRLAAGMAQLAGAFGVRIVGGNLARVPDRLVVDVTALGAVIDPLLRTGARPGDLVCVTGSLGRAGAGLALVRAGAAGAPQAGPLLGALLRPEPRVDAGMALAALGDRVHACCDISDGLALDLGRMCAASGVGAEIWAERLPLAEATRWAGVALDRDPLPWVLEGGEDYELLLAVPPAEEAAVRAALEPAGTGLSVVGAFTPAEGLRLGAAPGALAAPLVPRGWDPFV
jgi:thiamine-monophosphate kinase